MSFRFDANLWVPQRTSLGAKILIGTVAESLAMCVVRRTRFLLCSSVSPTDADWGGNFATFPSLFKTLPISCSYQSSRLVDTLDTFAISLLNLAGHDPAPNACRNPLRNLIKIKL